jgi:D,D-heptose 1,7-bisphosphate phosphatase
MPFPRQCAILMGGLGTRLGELTAETPKPMLNCGGRPFLMWVLRELSRFGIEEAVLLVGYRADKVTPLIETVASQYLPKPIRINLSCEPKPSGTGGALWHARELLNPQFLLINGDSWFDTNLAAFMAEATNQPPALVHMLLRKTEDTSRYGVVEFSGGRVTGFYERSADGNRGIMNAGIYLVQKNALSFTQPTCSLEREVLPELARLGQLKGYVSDGYFIDIGTPNDFVRATNELPKRLHRPAAFFDRDGVLNEEGYVGSIERFQWNRGSQAAVRAVTDAGFHAFIVTNQAGLARGLYSEDDLKHLHRWMIDEINAAGGTIDDLRYCSSHPDALNPIYRQNLHWRKPAPSMILNLASKWEINRAPSFLVGDKDTDILAARNAGIAGHLFTHNDLSAFVSQLLVTGSRLQNPSH